MSSFKIFSSIRWSAWAPCALTSARVWRQKAGDAEARGDHALHPLCGICFLWLALSGSALAATGQPSSPNSAYIDADGAIHLTRVVPPPTTISEQAREKLEKPPVSILSSVSSLAEQRRLIDARQTRDAAQCLKTYPAKVSDSQLAGVPVRIVTPVTPDPANADRVLINLHGGGFRTDTGSLLESIPIANLTRIKVIAVLYGLAPENPFPVPVDQTIAVYRELLKTYAPDKIALYGTSAGAILTAQSAAKIKQLGLPLPAVLGIFSGTGDSSQAGDSMALFGMQGLSGTLLPRSTGPSTPDLKDPIRSPLYSDLKGMPPTLFLTSTRDMLLSGTVILHRAFLEAGVDAQLIVYEALPHAFWLDPNLPESQSANRHIAEFLKGHLR